MAEPSASRLARQLSSYVALWLIDETRQKL
jgi:hypothetical protein